MGLTAADSGTIMSHPDPTHSSAEASSQSDSQPSSLTLNGKAPALAPQVSADDGNVELRSMAPAEPVLAADRDIMQLARLGDIAAIQRLYDAGTFTPSHCDEEGITPLHVGCPGVPFLCTVTDRSL